MNIPTFGYWFFDELASVLGYGKPSIYLETPNFGTFKVKASSTRLECMVRSSKCVTCGMVGSFWLLQSHHVSLDGDGNLKIRDTPHLNLYAVNDNDTLVLMTRDHIIPRAHGGLDTLENLQTMCSPCNSKKGCKLPAEVQDDSLISMP